MGNAQRPGVPSAPLKYRVLTRLEVRREFRRALAILSQSRAQLAEPARSHARRRLVEIGLKVKK
jgi:hypothetical protein